MNKIREHVKPNTREIFHNFVQRSDVTGNPFEWLLGKNNVPILHCIN